MKCLEFYIHKNQWLPGGRTGQTVYLKGILATDWSARVPESQAVLYNETPKNNVVFWDRHGWRRSFQSEICPSVSFFVMIHFQLQTRCVEIALFYSHLYYTLVYLGTCWYILVRIGISWYTLVYFGTPWYIYFIFILRYWYIIELRARVLQQYRWE